MGGFKVAASMMLHCGVLDGGGEQHQSLVSPRV